MNRFNLRYRRRGAVFVESIVVIGFFTLCFLGIVYFRELYLGKMRVQRLARASAMAHAMGACNVDPKAGLEDDVPKNAPAPLGSSKTPGKPLELDADQATAQDALNGFDRSKTGTPLDEITAIRLTTSAAATMKKDPAAAEVGFRSDVSATSFVTCGDPVSDGSYEEVIPHIESVFSSFF